jgi:flagellar basal-body rod modification protein FlgD
MSAVSSLASSISSNSTTAPGGMSALSSDDFLKIIFTELTKQDPLAPNDTNALLQQISTVRSIQSDVDLSSNLKSLVGQSEFAAAAQLIGKQVSGLSATDGRVTGIVSSVSRTDEGPVLTLASGAKVALKQLDEVVSLDRTQTESIDQRQAKTEVQA